MPRLPSPLPPHRGSVRRRTLVVVACASLALLFAFFVLRDSPPDPGAPLAAELAAAAPLAAPPPPRPADTFPASAARRSLAELPPAERNVALDQLEERFRADPAANAEAVAAAALELEPHSPAEAFFFLTRFHDFEVITQAKRRIVLDWSAAGLDDIASTMRRQVSEQRGGCEFLMPFLVSIYQNERAAEFPAFIGWVNTFAAPAEREIQVAAANSFLRLSQPAQRPAIARLYAKQAEMHAWSTALLVQHAGASPTETLELLGHADFAGLSAPLAGDVLRAVAQTSPETASAVVRTDYLHELAADRARMSGEKLSAVRDELVSGLLNGLLVSNPASAWELVDHISDADARRQMLNRIEALIDARH